MKYKKATSHTFIEEMKSLPSAALGLKNQEFVLGSVNFMKL